MTCSFTWAILTHLFVGICPGIFNTFQPSIIFNIKTSHVICHCVKSVRIQSFSGLYFPALVLNMGTYGLEKLRIRTLFTQFASIWIATLGWDGLRQFQRLGKRNQSSMFLLLLFKEGFWTNHDVLKYTFILRFDLYNVFENEQRSLC